MYHNIKVDLIYHNTPADYEMEFNLGGCCRMRLLNSKTEDVKSFLHNLARAVNRSRVVLIAGPLFGENGLFSLISHAINRPLEQIDCAAYGLQSDLPISLIDGATPLVTENGLLAGCIIESGPQTMIILSENKTVRKSIMAPLIHPYIAQLAAQDSGEKPSLFVPDTSEETHESSEQNSEGDDETPVSSEEIHEEKSEIPDGDSNEQQENESSVSQDEPDISLEQIPVSGIAPSVPETEPLSEEKAEQNSVSFAISDAEEPETTEELPKTPEPQTAEKSTITEEPSATEKPANGEDSADPEEEYILDLEGSFPAGYDDQSEDPDFILEVDPKGKKKRSDVIQDNIDFMMSDIDSDFHFEETENPFIPKPRFQLPILILFIALLVILALLIFFAVFIPLSAGNSPLQYLKDIFSQLSGKS